MQTISEMITEAEKGAKRGEDPVFHVRFYRGKCEAVITWYDLKTEFPQFCQSIRVEACGADQSFTDDEIRDAMSKAIDKWVLR